jgi:predicted PurR-regulated permease PerM
MKKSNIKAQGAIEYLLILGAAILVVAIVVVAVTNIIQQGQTQTNSSTSSQQKAVNDLWKLKAGTLKFSDYAYGGSDYTKTVIFGS